MRSRLTYANVASSLALLLALAGGTAWATGQIGPRQIKQDAVRAKHIKDGHVRSAQIADGTLTAADVADESITSAEVAEDALGSGDIDERDLRFSCRSSAAFGGEIGDVCYSPRFANAQTLAQAQKSCEDFDLRLPSVGEARLIHKDVGTLLKNTNVWTDDATSQTAAMTVGQGTNGVIGSVETAASAQAAVFCVSDPILAVPRGTE
jgi:hypothetical protein